MRIIWILLVALFLGVAESRAQSQMRITTTNRSKITVAVDGRYFNRRGTAITVGDLPPGRHSVKIYAIQYDRWGSAYQRLMFQGRVTTDYRMTTNVVFNPYSRMANIRQIASEWRDGANDEDYAAYKDGAHEESSSPVPGTPAASSPLASPAPMGSLVFSKQEALKKKTDGESTDTKKLATVKNGLSGETVSTTQVMDIMDWFLFESTRLEFSKWAYNITIDKQSYKDLAKKFEVSANRQDFEAFVKKHQ
ncbi:MAG: DUF4476 domain-containing protein [Taibaiella sp.]|nr:DUF4476 domain-containing protein [Taibaiella sp.]